MPVVITHIWHVSINRCCFKRILWAVSQLKSTIIPSTTHCVSFSCHSEEINLFLQRHFNFFLCPSGVLYCAVRSYSTKKDDEVSVPIGSVVEVLQKSDDGWWLIRYLYSLQSKHVQKALQGHERDVLNVAFNTK